MSELLQVSLLVVFLFTGVNVDKVLLGALHLEHHLYYRGVNILKLTIRNLEYII